jgi:hypothetical protein
MRWNYAVPNLATVHWKIGNLEQLRGQQPDRFRQMLSDLGQKLSSD